MSLKKESEKHLQMDRKSTSFKKEQPKSFNAGSKTSSKNTGKGFKKPEISFKSVLHKGADEYSKEAEEDDQGVETGSNIIKKSYKGSKKIVQSIKKHENKNINNRANQIKKSSDEKMKSVEKKFKHANKHQPNKVTSKLTKGTTKREDAFMRKIIKPPTDINKKGVNKGISSYKRNQEIYGGASTSEVNNKLVKKHSRAINQTQRVRRNNISNGKLKDNQTKLKTKKALAKKSSNSLQNSALAKKTKTRFKKRAMRRSINRHRVPARVISTTKNVGVALKSTMLAMKKMLALMLKKAMGTKLGLALGAVFLKLSPIFLIGGLLFGLIIVVMAMAGGGEEMENQTGIKMFDPKVEQWRDLVTEIAEEKDMMSYINLALAIIEVETGGDKHRDIMQSSESAGYPKNHYDNERDSVNQGITHLKNAVNTLKRQDEKLVNDSKAIAQTYNFGLNYARYLGENNEDSYDIEISEKYSREVVAVALGNTTGATYPYVNNISEKLGKTYLYSNGGNFMYGEMVGQYIVDYADGEIAPPVSPIIINDYFGYRPPEATGGIGSTNHKGLDLHCVGGETPINAFVKGTVVTSEFHKALGNNIVIKHDDAFYTRYAHMSSLIVSVGQEVQTGQTIGVCGTTGSSTGPHLHFEVSGTPGADHVDPLPYIQPLLGGN